jgi:hypothetical protein
MDPNANLDQIRGMVLSYRNGGKWDEPDTTEFIELVAALDDWLSNGGFVPQKWSKQWATG